VTVSVALRRVSTSDMPAHVSGSVTVNVSAAAARTSARQLDSPAVSLRTSASGLAEGPSRSPLSAHVIATRPSWRKGSKDRFKEFGAHAHAVVLWTATIAAYRR